MPHGVVYERRPSERSGSGQVATADSLTVGLSVTRAMVSSDMYRRATAHSSLVSSISAPTSRMMASSLGKMPMTSERRFTSRFTRSSGLVEAIWAQCSRGKDM